MTEENLLHPTECDHGRLVPVRNGEWKGLLCLNCQTFFTDGEVRAALLFVRQPCSFKSTKLQQAVNDLVAALAVDSTQLPVNFRRLVRALEDEVSGSTNQQQAALARLRGPQ